MIAEFAAKETVNMDTIVRTMLSRVWDAVSRLKTLIAVAGLL
jgi:hypothetical protein